MTHLLDTHVLIWWIANDQRMSSHAREVLSDRSNRLLWSAASTWELAIKVSLGKLRLPESVGTFVERRLAQNSIDVLQISHAHAAAVQELPYHHRDPFDRMLVAQAKSEQARLLTGDPWVRAYGVDVAW
ncbi:MAG: type II toxin-antitoxin system VapC family toxin [Myxococcota bacterium]